jgi:ABC-2 type transport system permease protein
MSVQKVLPMKRARLNTISGVLTRECLRFLREPIQTIFNTVFTDFVFLVTLSFLAPHNLSFIVPGILMYTSFNVVLSNVKMSIFVGKMDRTIYYQLAAPISRVELFIIYHISNILRSLIVNALILALIMVMYSQYGIYNISLFAACWLLMNILFINISILITLFYKNWNSVGSSENYVVTPLLLLSGSFFSIWNVPTVLRNVMYLNPFLYMVNLLRYTYIGVTQVSIVSATSVFAVLIVATTAICLYFFNMGFKLLK